MDVDSEHSISIKARHGESYLGQWWSQQVSTRPNQFRAGPFAFDESVGNLYSFGQRSNTGPV